MFAACFARMQPAVDLLGICCSRAGINIKEELVTRGKLAKGCEQPSALKKSAPAVSRLILGTGWNIKLEYQTRKQGRNIFQNPHGGMVGVNNGCWSVSFISKRGVSAKGHILRDSLEC
jgi:hypothetical protein